jgi:hypothetical protein
MWLNVADEIKAVRKAVDHLYLFTPRNMNNDQAVAFEEAAFDLADRAGKLATEISDQRCRRA